MASVKITCKFEEMRTILRALNNYKCDLESHIESLPESWRIENSSDEIQSIINRLIWENSDWR